VVDVHGQNAAVVLEFPFVNTAASSRFYVRTQWSSDSSALFVAIPDPKLVYATTFLPPTALWQIRRDGTKTQLGEVSADFFAQPEFSPDGKSILYARRVGKTEDNRLALFQANSDGTDEQEIARDNIGTIEPAHWMPDGQHYTFVRGNPGEVWTMLESGLARFPNDQETVFTLMWVDEQTAVYETTSGGANELRFYAGSGNPELIVSRSTGGDFDARREP
jgi:Tol biopolymer transport system component